MGLTYVWDIWSLVLSEFFVVAQKENSVFQSQCVVEITLGLSFSRRFHLDKIHFRLIEPLRLLVSCCNIPF